MTKKKKKKKLDNETGTIKVHFSWHRKECKTLIRYNWFHSKVCTESPKAAIISITRSLSSGLRLLGTKQEVWAKNWGWIFHTWMKWHFSAVNPVFPCRCVCYCVYIIKQLFLPTPKVSRCLCRQCLDLYSLITEDVPYSAAVVFQLCPWLEA